MKIPFFLRAIYFYPLAVVLSALISLTVTYGLLASAYEANWTVIKRVQTVDFNILSHVMPVAIKPYVASGDAGPIQKMVDANYGVFPIDVFSCLDRACERRELMASNRRKPSADQRHLSADGEVLELPVFDEPGYLVTHSYAAPYSEVPTVSAAKKPPIAVIRLSRTPPPTMRSDIERLFNKLAKGEEFASRDIAYMRSLWVGAGVFTTALLALMVVRISRLIFLRRQSSLKRMKAWIASQGKLSGDMP